MGTGTIYGDKLLPVGQIRVEPGENRSGESEVGGKAVQEDGVGDGVKSCREIQQNQNTDVAYISSHEEIICDFNQGGLRAVVGSVARLEGFEEVMVGHVLMELCSYCSFQGLAEERKVGDRPVVCKVIRVQTRLLQDGGNRGNFETGGYGA